MGIVDQRGQILGAGLIFARQAGWLYVTGVLHAHQLGLDVHLGHKNLQTTWECAPQGMRSAVFAGHQGQMQQLATAQFGAYAQTGGAAFFGVHIRLGDRDDFIHGQLGFADQYTRHELGDGGDRQHRRFIFAEQDFIGVLVDDQRHAGLQIQLVLHTVQSRQLPIRRPGGCHSDHFANQLGAGGLFNYCFLRQSLFGYRLNGTRLLTLRGGCPFLGQKHEGCYQAANTELHKSAFQHKSFQK